MPASFGVQGPGETTRWVGRDMNASSTTSITGNVISGCKTAYYHFDGTASQVTFQSNRIASCGWGAAAYSSRLKATGNDIDADIGFYVAGAVSPAITGNYYSDFRQNSGFPTVRLRQ